MNERTHYIKIYPSDFTLEKVDVSVVCERWVERHIVRVRTFSSHIFFWETPLLGCVSLAQVLFSELRRKLTTWLSSRVLLQVTHLVYLSALIVLSCSLITMWQVFKAHGVTRNEPKIHGICYITESHFYCCRLHIILFNINDLFAQS